MHEGSRQSGLHHSDLLSDTASTRYDLTMERREHHIKIERTARYVTLGEPHHGLAQVWFACHGYGQLAHEFLDHFEVLNDGTRLIVAAEGLSRFYRDAAYRKIGASWMTSEDRLNEIDDYVAYLESLYTHVFERVDRDSVDVVVLGFSQGVATAARWIAHGTVHAEHLILWAQLTPPEFRSREGFRRLRALDLTLVYGTRDKSITSAHLAEQQDRLEAHGVEARHVSFDGGHRMDRDTLLAIAKGDVTATG